MLERPFRTTRGLSDRPRAPSAIVAHVHDEVIIEADPETTVKEICDLMSQSPSWAKGLQLRADGYECEYYRKD